jgi:RNA polymerase sigma-70 factor (ECF subfamily)
VDQFNGRDRDLIKDSLKGNLFSFEVIVKRYQNQIYLHALRITNDQDLAEDITQETFIRVLEKLGSFKLNKPFLPWVYKIATNLTYDILRKEKKITPLNYEIEDGRVPVLDKIIIKEEKKELKKVFKNLPKKYKLPLFGFYFKGLSYRVLAEKLYLPLNTIRTRIRRGKDYLAKKLYGKKKTD